MQSFRLKVVMGFVAVFVLACLLVIAFSPHFYDPNRSLRKNESVAVASLAKINALQSKYAAAHPDEGFACQLRRLRPAEGSTTVYDSTTALLSGDWSGYKFALVGCTAATNGIVIRYQITAVPSSRGLSGVRAFCTDESGKLFYEENGSGTQCLSSRLPLW